ncbi:hypothetical protein HJG60_009853 [Phyllostomus discolor]|uniref:Uncharacterized protein n=1 Tax=Phyllostomus discolor TaxID=89673 RepID=A0A834B6W6_9CHIR|nr:hypothetical protein HJG60_009853 [Phyllostomus discolor]
MYYVSSYCVNHMSNSGKQNQSGCLLSWGAWSSGEGKKEFRNRYHVCWGGVHILAFMPHLWPDMSASTVHSSTSLALRPHRFGAVDHHIKERADPTCHNKALPDRLIPESMKERKAGLLALLPKPSSGVGFFHCFLICSFWDLIVKMRRGIKYRWESRLELKMTSRSPKPASLNLQCWLSAL